MSIEENEYEKFIRRKKQMLPSASTDDIREELRQRETSENIFPLHVFHPALQPMINAMVNHYDLDRGYIGLCMLSAYSTAIGTAFTVSTNGVDLIFLSVWGCMLGLSSSGKTFTLNKIYEPLFAIQKEFDAKWNEDTEGKSEAQIRDTNMPTVLFMDTYIPTLVRYIMPDNPKGVCKIADELLEWINGMNPGAKGGKDGTDEQFWIRTWNCAPAYVTRSGKQKTTIPRPFANIIGGTQYKLLPMFFAKNRDTTGFIFRLLFAIDDRAKIAEIDPRYSMPREFSIPHNQAINTLYNVFSVTDMHDEPGVCQLGAEAVNIYDAWVRQNIRRINNMDDVNDKDIQSGIFGKIKEYALRFAAILYIMDKALDAGPDTSLMGIGLSKHEFIPAHVMTRALDAVEYFYKSASTAYDRVKKQLYAPEDALRCATIFRIMKSYADGGKMMYGDPTDETDRDRKKKKFQRLVKKYMTDYPWLFNAKAR